MRYWETDVTCDNTETDHSVCDPEAEFTDVNFSLDVLLFLRLAHVFLKAGDVFFLFLFFCKCCRRVTTAHPSGKIENRIPEQFFIHLERFLPLSTLKYEYCSLQSATFISYYLIFAAVNMNKYIIITII